jgi:histidyl-tRNA synthetase
VQGVFRLYGYAPIDTPVLEPTDLFLRKAGEEIASRMYAFTHWNRNLCLRPEFTASIIRAYVNHLQGRPLPMRLHYAGPTFRYEKDGPVRHRQFTEVGIECIGAEGPTADAEVLAVARHGLEAVGVVGSRIVIGHLGAVFEILGQMGMSPRAQSLVIGVMEDLSRAPEDAGRVVERLAAMLGAGEEADALQDGALDELLQSFGPEQAARIATDLLERANFSLSGGVRSPSEIVERLLLKWHRPDPTPDLRRAVDFIAELRAVAGPPQEALPAVRRVLMDFGLHDGPVMEVESCLEYFEAYSGAPLDVSVDLSLARGLRYYTGMVFEVYDDEDNQIAGGGRYDDLVRALGGRVATPACGFSFGLERLVAAVERTRRRASPSASVFSLVVPVHPADYPEAAGLAAELRRFGLAVEMDVRGRGINANLQHADQQGIRFVLIVGEQERQEAVVALHDLSASWDTRVERADVIDAVLARAGDGTTAGSA